MLACEGPRAGGPAHARERGVCPLVERRSVHFFCPRLSVQWHCVPSPSEEARRVSDEAQSAIARSTDPDKELDQVLDEVLADVEMLNEMLKRVSVPLSMCLTQHLLILRGILARRVQQLALRPRSSTFRCPECLDILQLSIVVHLLQHMPHDSAEFVDENLVNR